MSPPTVVIYTHMPNSLNKTIYWEPGLENWNLIVDLMWVNLVMCALIMEVQEAKLLDWSSR